MFERFTKAARTAVKDGVEVARRSGAAEVRPDHVLGALVADAGSVAALAVAHCGATGRDLIEALDQLRSRLADGLDADDAEALAVLGIDLEDVVRRIGDLGGRPVSPRRHVPFSRGSKKALELSLREAIRLGDGYIGTEHLLLGLVRAGDRTVLDALAAVHLTADDLREAVATMERRAG
jgi:ATP-dependent Clp protease ATP-binding subunit ClpA